MVLLRGELWPVRKTSGESQPYPVWLQGCFGPGPLQVAPQPGAKEAGRAHWEQKSPSKQKALMSP